MIRLERHGDVVQLEMSTRRSRLAGFRVNAYLVRGALIDCGFPAAGDEFSRFVGDTRLRGVIITHHHEDHAGNAELVAARGVPMAAHPDALAAMRSPLPIAFYRRFTWGEAPPLESPVTAFLPDDLELVHTPGHSADHLAVWDPETGTLFSSDLFLGVKVRVAHHDEDPQLLIASLRRAVALGPVRLFDAHRGAVPTPTRALQAKIDWLEETIGAMASLFREGVSDAQVSRRVLGRRDTTDLFSGGEYSRLCFVQGVRRSVESATRQGVLSNRMRAKR